MYQANDIWHTKSFSDSESTPHAHSSPVFTISLTRFSGNNGLGLESCRQLCKHNAHVYLAARNPSKAESAIAEIKKGNPTANITFLKLDLSSLESVKKAADEFNAKTDRLDVLMNNGTFDNQSFCILNGRNSAIEYSRLVASSKSQTPRTTDTNIS